MNSTPTTPGHTAQSCAAALGDDLGWALGTLFRSYLKAVDGVMGDLPGGPRGYQILAIAASGLPGRQLALAQQLGVDRTVMTYLLDDLERAGFIERQLDPADRRARRIVATRQGHTLAAQLHRKLSQIEDEVLAGLDADERTQFRALLRRLTTHVDATEPGPAGGADPCSAGGPTPVDPSCGYSRSRA